MSRMKVERSSGNVFADIGLPHADALLAASDRKELQREWRPGTYVRFFRGPKTRVE